MLMLLFPVAQMVIGVIPDLAGIVADLLNIFKVGVNLSIIYSIESLLRGLISIAEYVVFAILAVMALAQKTVTIPLLDPFIDKHMN